MELVSIIVPAYNIKEYLPRCLDSILAQSYPHLEVIVVDDGSSDGTAQVLDRYSEKDSRILAIHKENGGVTAARLHGIAQAQGQWIGFVDGDDLIEPDMYETLLRNAHAHHADISHCGYRMVFPSRVDWYYNTGRVTVQPGIQGASDLLEGRFVEPGLWNKLYRRELFAGLDDWMDKSIRINEDLLMNFYLFRRCATAVHQDICPYHYILRKGSAAVSRLNEHKLADPLKVQYLLWEETGDTPQLRQIVERRLTYQLINTATLPLGSQKELIAPHRRKARKALRQGLRGVLAGSACSPKLKLMALWAAVWPGSYCLVHGVYAAITGSDKKYEVP